MEVVILMVDSDVQEQDLQVMDMVEEVVASPEVVEDPGMVPMLDLEVVLALITMAPIQ